MKPCSKCKEGKPLEMFHKSKRHIDCLFPWCKDCCSDYKKKRRGEKKEEIAAQRKAYRQTERGAELHRASERHRRQTENGKAKGLAAKKRYLQKLNLANCEVSRRTLNAWAAQVKQLRDYCNWCFSEDNLAAHHILPKSRFPQYALDVSNGLTLCEDCHTTIHKQEV